MSKTKKKTKRFQKNKSNPFGSNFILEGDNFCVSYNPNPWSLVPGFGSDNGGPETALIHCPNGERGICLVLNGDWRDEFAAIVDKGYDACLNLYNELAVEHRSSWSEDCWDDATRTNSVED